jgi:hypothetical protein
LPPQGIGFGEHGGTLGDQGRFAVFQAIEFPLQVGVAELSLFCAVAMQAGQGKRIGLLLSLFDFTEPRLPVIRTGDFQLVDQGCDPTPGLLKDRGQHAQPAVDARNFCINFAQPGSDGSFCRLPLGFQLLVFRRIADGLFGLLLLGNFPLQITGIGLDEALLVGTPGTQPVHFVVQSPRKRNNQQERPEQQVKAQRFAGDWVLGGLCGHP